MVASPEPLRWIALVKALRNCEVLRLRIPPDVGDEMGCVWGSASSPGDDFPELELRRRAENGAGGLNASSSSPRLVESSHGVDGSRIEMSGVG